MLTMALNSIMRNLLITAELLLFDANLIKQKYKHFLMIRNDTNGLMERSGL